MHVSTLAEKAHKLSFEEKRSCLNVIPACLTVNLSLNICLYPLTPFPALLMSGIKQEISIWQEKRSPH